MPSTTRLPKRDTAVGPHERRSQLPAVRSGVRESVRLIRHQVRGDATVLSRNMQAQFFAVSLPIVFLVLFVSIFGNEPTWVDGHWVRQSTYYVPAIAVFAIVDAAFMTPLVGLVTQREAGVLRRRRMTPEPSWVLVVGRGCSMFVTTLLVVGVLVAIGQVGYGVELPVDRIPVVLVNVLVGVTALCSLAFAISPLVRSAENGLSAAAGVALPLFFISGVFIPWATVPQPLQVIANVFPVRPLSHAMVHAFDPATSGSGFVASDLARLATWGVVGLVVARRWFAWMPQAGRQA